jgi:Icc-related predicted phosphoesterase
MLPKFLGAAKFHDASVLIMGGDLTGKAMVPIVETGDRIYRAQFHGEIRTLRLDELEDFERNVRFDGFYPYRVTRLSTSASRERNRIEGEVFSRLMVHQIQEWVRLSEERLAPSGVRCYMMPGNDDEFAIDEVFASAYVVNPEGLCVEFDGVQMLSSCWTNRTPWDSPREEDEKQLRLRLRELAGS